MVHPGQHNPKDNTRYLSEIKIWTLNAHDTSLKELQNSAHPIAEIIFLKNVSRRCCNSISSLSCMQWLPSTTHLHLWLPQQKLSYQTGGTLVASQVSWCVVLRRNR